MGRKTKKINEMLNKTSEVDDLSVKLKKVTENFSDDKDTFMIIDYDRLLARDSWRSNSNGLRKGNKTRNISDFMHGSNAMKYIESVIVDTVLYHNKTPSDFSLYTRVNKQKSLSIHGFEQYEALLICSGDTKMVHYPTLTEDLAPSIYRHDTKLPSSVLSTRVNDISELKSSGIDFIYTGYLSSEDYENMSNEQFLKRLEFIRDNLFSIMGIKYSKKLSAFMKDHVLSEGLLNRNAFYSIIDYVLGGETTLTDAEQYIDSIKTSSNIIEMIDILKKNFKLNADKLPHNCTVVGLPNKILNTSNVFDLITEYDVEFSNYNQVKVNLKSDQKPICDYLWSSNIRKSTDHYLDSIVVGFNSIEDSNEFFDKIVNRDDSKYNNAKIAFNGCLPVVTHRYTATRNNAVNIHESISKIIHLTDIGKSDKNERVKIKYMYSGAKNAWNGKAGMIHFTHDYFNFRKGNKKEKFNNIDHLFSSIRKELKDAIIEKLNMFARKMEKYGVKDQQVIVHKTDSSDIKRPIQKQLEDNELRINNKKMSIIKDYNNYTKIYYSTKKSFKKDIDIINLHNGITIESIDQQVESTLDCLIAFIKNNTMFYNFDYFDEYYIFAISYSFPIEVDDTNIEFYRKMLLQQNFLTGPDNFKEAKALLYSNDPSVKEDVKKVMKAL